METTSSQELSVHSVTDPIQRFEVVYNAWVMCFSTLNLECPTLSSISKEFSILVDFLEKNELNQTQIKGLHRTGGPSDLDMIAKLVNADSLKSPIALELAEKVLNLHIKNKNKLIEELYPHLLREILSLTYCLPNLIEEIIKPDSGVFNLYLERLPAAFSILRSAPDSLTLEVSACFAYFLEMMTPMVQIIFNEPNCAPFSSILTILAKEIIPFVQIRVEEDKIAALPISGLISLLQSMIHGIYSDSTSSDAFFALYSLIINSQTVRNLLALSDKGCLLDLLLFSLNFEGNDQDDMCISAINTLIAILPLPDDTGFKNQQYELLDVAIVRASELLPELDNSEEIYHFYLDDQELKAGLSEIPMNDTCRVIFPQNFNRVIENKIIELNFQTLYQNLNQTAESHGPTSYLSRAYLELIRKIVQSDLTVIEYILNKINFKHIWFLIYALFMDYNVAISNYLANDEPWSHILESKIILSTTNNENLYWSLNLAQRHMSLFPDKSKAMLTRASALIRTFQPLAVCRLVHLLATNETSLCNTLVIDSIFAADCVFRSVLYTNPNEPRFREAHSKSILFLDHLMKEKKSNTLVFCNQTRLSSVLSYLSEVGVSSLVIEWITKTLSTSKTPFLLIKSLIVTLIGSSDLSGSLINTIRVSLSVNSIQILKCLQQESMLSTLTENVSEVYKSEVFEEYLELLKSACDIDRAFSNYVNSMSSFKKLNNLIGNIDVTEKGLEAGIDLIAGQDGEIRVQIAIPLIHQWTQGSQYRERYLDFLQGLVDNSLINRYLISKVRYLSLLLPDRSDKAMKLAITTGGTFFARRDLPALINLSEESGNFEKFTETVIGKSEKPFIHVNDGLGLTIKDLSLDIPFMISAVISITKKSSSGTFLSLSDTVGSTISMASRNDTILCTLVNEGKVYTETILNQKQSWIKVSLDVHKKSVHYTNEGLSATLPYRFTSARLQSSMFSLHFSSVDIASLEIDGKSYDIENLGKYQVDGIAVRHAPSLADAIATSGGAPLILKRLSSNNLPQILRIFASLAHTRPEAFSDTRFFRALAYRLSQIPPGHFTKEASDALYSLFSVLKEKREIALRVYCDFGITSKFPGIIPRFYKDHGFFGHSALLLGGPEKLPINFSDASEIIRLAGASIEEIEALACDSSCEGIQEAAIKELISRGYQGLALAIFTLGSPYRGVQLAALELASRTGKIINAHSACLPGDVIAAVLRNRSPYLIPILCISNHIPDNIDRVREGYEKGILTANSDIWMLPLLWFAREQGIGVWSEAITTGIFTRPSHVSTDITLLSAASIVLGLDFEETLSKVYLSVSARDNREIALAFLPIISLGIYPQKKSVSPPTTYIHFLTTLNTSVTFEAVTPMPDLSPSMVECSKSLLTFLTSGNFSSLTSGTSWLLYVRLLSRLHQVDPVSATEFFSLFCDYAKNASPETLSKPVQALSYLDCDPSWSTALVSLISLVSVPQVVSLNSITTNVITALVQSLDPVALFIQKSIVIPQLSLKLMEVTKTAYRREARLNQIAHSNLFRETGGTHRRLDLSVDGFGRHLRTRPNPHFDSPPKPLRPLGNPLLSEGMNCELITPSAIYSGRVAVIDGYIIFEVRHATDHMTDARREARKVIQISLSSVRHVFNRRYHLNDRGLEFIVHPLTPYFLVFPDASYRETFLKMSGKMPPHLDLSKLTKKWRERKLSNYEYLYWLNLYAGRSFSDPSQYPVFPWILSDYTSETLDLSKASVFRDLSLPIGAINPERLEALKTLKKDLIGSDFPSLYRMHYSNPAYVAHFLVRLLPFTSLHLGLQKGNFDAADRLFLSVGDSWKSAVSTQPDFRELVPEFFTLPDFLINGDNRDLGTLRDGKTKVNDVTLPTWATSPGHFISLHRLALESDYVSLHLHNWIDLIFGFKQRGKAAEDACNDFSRSSYFECLTDPDANPDALGSAAACFGTTPDQLFKDPHPYRKVSSIYPLSSSSCSFNVFSKPSGMNYDKLVGLGFYGRQLYLYDDTVGMKILRYEKGLFTVSMTQKVPDMGSRDLLSVFTKEGKICVSSLTSDYVAVGDYGSWSETPKSAACVNCIAADGNLVAIGGEDAAVVVWNMKENKSKHIVGHESAILSVFVNEVMDLVASADENGMLLITSITEGEPDKIKLKGMAKFITVTTFGLIVAITENSSRGSTVEALDLGGRRISEIDCRYDATAACLCEMPDMGEFLMISLKNRNAMLLRIHDMAPVAVFKLESTVTKLTYSNEEQIAVAYMENGDTVILEVSPYG